METNHNCTKMHKYEFIEADKLHSVYDISEIWDKPNKVYWHFRESCDEVIYILDQGAVFGLISIGDMYRYYRSKKERLPINQKFSYVESPTDYEKAEAFFHQVKTIHEIPVISGGLLGVIRKKENKKMSKEQFNNILTYERMVLWAREKCSQFNKLANMEVLYYDMSGKTECLTEEEENILQKRRTITNSLECFEKMTEAEQKRFVGERYHKKYIEQFASDYKQLKLCQKNGVYRYSDCCNGTFHISNGYRRIPNVPNGAKRKIWVFGLCTAFGHYVADDATIEYYLQNYLIENGYDNYEVINAGTTAREYGRWWVEEMSPDDIAIIVNQFIPMYNQLGERKIEPVVEALGNRYKGDLSELCVTLEHPMECIIDGIPHCNFLMNQKIAEKMFIDVLPNLTHDIGDIAPRVSLQDYFIPWEVIEYYEAYIESHGIDKKAGKKTGAIVMNCNPFTLGHRYLIEQACAQVDILYIFVVEEDASHFKFEDRIEMVKQGTRDIDKVRILPSGKYIISKETFAQYFEKEQIIAELDDVDYDVRIFGEVVAKMLGITCRFVGEEPFDKVTREYNETMKRILPEYNIELIEIPRKVNDGVCISASRVRKYLEQGEIEKAYKLLPESTRKYLMRN